VASSEARLWKGIVELAGSRRVIVTGFSQGGVLSFTIAARHPDVVTRAFPVAGACPRPLVPTNRARAAPLLAFHGTIDPVLDVARGREAVQAFKEQGNEAELREYQGIDHQLGPFRKELWDVLGETIAP
jgi:phospholipase/carboxylesterase